MLRHLLDFLFSIRWTPAVTSWNKQSIYCPHGKLFMAILKQISCYIVPSYPPQFTITPYTSHSSISTTIPSLSIHSSMSTTMPLLSIHSPISTTMPSLSTHSQRSMQQFTHLSFSLKLQRKSPTLEKYSGIFCLFKVFSGDVSFCCASPALLLWCCWQGKNYTRI